MHLMYLSKITCFLKFVKDLKEKGKMIETTSTQAYRMQLFPQYSLWFPFYWPSPRETKNLLFFVHYKLKCLFKNNFIKQHIWKRFNWVVCNNCLCPLYNDFGSHHWQNLVRLHRYLSVGDLGSKLRVTTWYLAPLMWSAHRGSVHHYYVFSSSYCWLRLKDDALN